MMFLALLILQHSVISFLPHVKKTFTPSTFRSALSERQAQFWDDVKAGLPNDPENPSLSRIQQFIDTAMTSPKQIENIPGLTKKPFWDVSTPKFPWSSDLESAASTIISEYNSVTNSNMFLFDNDSAQASIMGSSWSTIRLQRLGVWNPKTTALFPETTKLLQSFNIPFAVRGVMFARQNTNSGVAPHNDGRNFILTAHLGIKVPSCEMSELNIKVDGIEKEWKTGKILILDTSFEHSTVNNSGEEVSQASQA